MKNSTAPFNQALRAIIKALAITLNCRLLLSDRHDRGRAEND